MPITTDVTWDDLIVQYDDELAQISDAYGELQEMATDRYGEDALDRPLPSDSANVPDEDLELWVMQQHAAQYDSAKRSIENRRHVLNQLRDEYGGGVYVIKMLTGRETMDIETELRTMAQREDANMNAIQIQRNRLTVDEATVDAPEGIPRDGDDSPVPSECPNALTLSLWEQVERFNNAGSVDFRPEGFGHDDPAQAPTSGASASPTPSGSPSSSSASTDGGSQPSGDS